MIRKCIVKEMLEKIKRQNNTIEKIETIRKKGDIERGRQKSTLVELVNKGWTNKCHFQSNFSLLG